MTENTEKPNSPAMKVGGKYNWKNQPDCLIYLGKKGFWHQFKKIEDPREVWCEVLDSDLDSIEETPPTALAVDAALTQEPVAVYLVMTGETHDGQETYTRHDVRPPLCDAEKLFATPQLAARVAVTVASAIAAWNAQADEFNQWPNLGEDEKLEWVAGLKLGAASVASAPLQPRTPAEHSEPELKRGFDRYEKARKLNPRQWTELHTRNLAGEFFDDMIDALPPAHPDNPAEPSEVNTDILQAYNNGYALGLRQLDRSPPLQPCTLDAPITNEAVLTEAKQWAKVEDYTMGNGEPATRITFDVATRLRRFVEEVIAAGRAATPAERDDSKEVLAVYDKLHAGKLGAHWLWVVIEQIAAGASEAVAMKSFGYYEQGSPQQAISGDKAEGGAASSGSTI